jgi:hypothetical protein
MVGLEEFRLLEQCGYAHALYRKISSGQPKSPEEITLKKGLPDGPERLFHKICLKYKRWCLATPPAFFLSLPQGSIHSPMI